MVGKRSPALIDSKRPPRLAELFRGPPPRGGAPGRMRRPSARGSPCSMASLAVFMASDRDPRELAAQARPDRDREQVEEDDDQDEEQGRRIDHGLRRFAV